MKYWKYAAPLVVAVLVSAASGALADDNASLQQADQREAEMDQRMREAEQRMAEAAREMAALASERIPHIQRIERQIVVSDRPRMGVTIGVGDHKGPVEGAHVVAVTPGSAASDTGLRAGDVITSINAESMSGSNAGAANQKLLDFMGGIEEGDALDVEYLRNGKVGKVEVTPKVMTPNVYVWDGTGNSDIDIQVVPGMSGFTTLDIEPGAPRVMSGSNFGWVFAGNGLGDMELVELNEGLGRYFGTDAGLLVVSVPDSNKLQLQDGDVIQSIDGREPRSVRHGLQILGSYQAGEQLEITIMRDKKSKKLNIEMPDGRTSRRFEFFGAPASPVSAPVPARAPAVVIERT